MPRVLKADLERENARLKREIEQWEQQCKSLQDDVDYWVHENDEKYFELEELRHGPNCIHSVDNFKNFLKVYKGYDDDDCLFEYINEYMRYYND